MDRNLILLPVLFQVALTLLLFIRLGAVKSRAVRLAEVDEGRRALHRDAWPDYVHKVNNNIDKQFETPVLSLVAWAGNAVDWVVLALSWPSSERAWCMPISMSAPTWWRCAGGYSALVR